jgi:hypothetical protein
MDTLQTTYLKFPKEYSLYDEYFKKHQSEYFLIIDKLTFIFENRDLWEDWEQQLGTLEREKDILMRMVIGEINLALHEDEADFDTKTMVREITRLAFSEAAYREYIKYKPIYKSAMHIIHYEYL